MTAPITPSEVVALKQTIIPDTVIDVFNELIAKGWNGGQSRVMQDEAANLIASRLDIKRHEVFNNHYLDVEPIYKAAGWKVYYDKPAYCENYEAYFIFSRA